MLLKKNINTTKQGRDNMKRQIKVTQNKDGSYRACVLFDDNEIACIDNATMAVAESWVELQSMHADD